MSPFKTHITPLTPSFTITTRHHQPNPSNKHHHKPAQRAHKQSRSSQTHTQRPRRPTRHLDYCSIRQSRLLRTKCSRRSCHPTTTASATNPSWPPRHWPPRRPSSSRRNTQHRRHARPSRLLGHIPIIQTSIARPRKSARHPRVLIRKLPDHHAHAFWRAQARVHHRDIILGLLLNGRRRRRQRHSDIQLRNSNLDPQASKLVKNRHQILRAGRAAYGKMALKPHAIDARATA